MIDALNANGNRLWRFQPKALARGRIPDRECPRNPPRTAHDPATRLGTGQKRTTLRAAPSPPLPLVALCMERTHGAQGRCCRPGSHRHPAPSPRTASRHQNSPLPLSHRPPLRAGRAALQKTETGAPFYKSLKMNHSWFANYKKLLVRKLRGSSREFTCTLA